MSPAKADPETGEIEPFDLSSLPMKSVDPEAIARDLFRRVLEAPSLDAALDVMEGKTSRDYIGKVFEFSDVELQWYQPRDREEAIPSVKCKAKGADGETIDFWTSSTMCVAILAKAHMTGALPVSLRVTERRTSSGQNALNFERP